ncbi:hypothetical protein, partial [Leisingera sp. ANG59]|uniref:hypothetical protein n=1 Tax=Leisingera sp. ANG59 TaxID=2675221 RepID=UPI0020C655AE
SWISSRKKSASSLLAITPGRSIMVSVIVLSFVVIGFNNLRLRRCAVAASPAARCAKPMASRAASYTTGWDATLSYGSIVSVQIGQDKYITTLTDDGICELKDMLADARRSPERWNDFLQDSVDDPDIIARVKDQPPR